MKNKASSSASSFHTKLIELEKIYHLIQESDDRDLETIIGLYEKGMKLALSLEKKITEYETRIEDVQASSVRNNEEATQTPAVLKPKRATNNTESKTPKVAEASDKQDEFGTSFGLFSTE